jgi:serine/threonine-protein kinase RsbW
MIAQKKDGTFEIIIASETYEARRVQEEIEAQLRLHHFAERDIFGIKLALEEALINAIKHGNQLDPNKRVFVRYRIEPPRFQVSITDEGPGFDLKEVPDPLAVENLERPCGRGLLLIHHYMNEVFYQPPGNHLSMMKICQVPHRNGLAHK